MLEINGENIKANYGAYLLEASLNKIVEYPKLKKVDSNNWEEYDFLEVDLIEPRLDKKEFNVKMIVDTDKMRDFYDFLQYNTNWHFTELNKTFHFLFMGFASIKQNKTVTEISVMLNETKPLLGYTYSAPNCIVEDYGYKIDNISIAKYGIIPTAHNNDFLLESLKQKKVLEINNRLINGVNIDSNFIRAIETPKAELACFIKLPIAEFWQAYYTFLYNLTKPNARIFSNKKITIPFYYKSANVSHFSIVDNTIRCEFKINLQIISE